MIAMLRVMQLAEIQAQQNGEGLSTAVLASPVIMIEVDMIFDGKIRYGSTACELSYTAPPGAKTLTDCTARCVTLSTTTIGWFNIFDSKVVD